VFSFFSVGFQGFVPSLSLGHVLGLSSHFLLSFQRSFCAGIHCSWELGVLLVSFPFFWFKFWEDVCCSDLVRPTPGDSLGVSFVACSRRGFGFASWICTSGFVMGFFRSLSLPCWACSSSP
jgi:hypothetical protein